MSRVVRLGSNYFRIGNNNIMTKWGNGLRFDGVNDWINLGNPAKLSIGGTGSFSVGATIYPELNRGTVFGFGQVQFNDAGLIRLGTPPFNPIGTRGIYVGLLPGSSAGVFRFILYGGGTEIVPPAIQYRTTSEFPINRLYTFTFTKVANNRNLGDVLFFIDGVQSTLELVRFTASSWPAWETQAYISGTEAYSEFNPIYGGIIYDLFASNIPFTLSDYLNYVNNRVPNNAVFHLKFDNKHGTFIRDFATNPITINVSANFSTATNYGGGAWVTSDRNTAQ